MRTVKDLADALLAAASEAAAGKANIEQVTALCHCADSLVRLARMEIDARNWEIAETPIRIDWLQTKNKDAK